MGEVAEALQSSSMGPALFIITIDNVNKGASGEVTKFPNNMTLGRSAGVRASSQG